MEKFCSYQSPCFSWVTIAERFWELQGSWYKAMRQYSISYEHWRHALQEKCLENSWFNTIKRSPIGQNDLQVLNIPTKCLDLGSCGLKGSSIVKQNSLVGCHWDLFVAESSLARLLPLKQRRYPETDFPMPTVDISQPTLPEPDEHYCHLSSPAIQETCQIVPDLLIATWRGNWRPSLNKRVMPKACRARRRCAQLGLLT